MSLKFCMVHQLACLQDIKDDVIIVKAQPVSGCFHAVQPQQAFNKHTPISRGHGLNLKLQKSKRRVWYSQKRTPVFYLFPKPKITVQENVILGFMSCSLQYQINTDTKTETPSQTKTVQLNSINWEILYEVNKKGHEKCWIKTPLPP